uniref:Conotoxin Vc6.13 n=1 Tax=Conus victoriae TaxID=319920 RepID=O26D_CONVC|nr:RecName: Full=Conotoxin Vc6.13; Flags: Precursor [Conus victoriae]AEA35362.1 O-conotoxin Vc6.13 precursor [Conus victoriae]
MEKLTILLLVAAVLMSIQALNQEQHQRAKINLLSKRKAPAERWWRWGGCLLWFGRCTKDSECCSDSCDRTYCELARFPEGW